MTSERQPDVDRAFRRLLSKVPEVTARFWIVKILATAAGETFADFVQNAASHAAHRDPDPTVSIDVKNNPASCRRVRPPSMVLAVELMQPGLTRPSVVLAVQLMQPGLTRPSAPPTGSPSRELGTGGIEDLVLLAARAAGARSRHHSMAWRATAGGSRPASSQLPIVAMRGRPTTTSRMSRTGTGVSRSLSWLRNRAITAP